VGLTPTTTVGDPPQHSPLTSDRRKEFVKLAAKYAEEGRVSIRNIRRDALDTIRKQEKTAKFLKMAIRENLQS